MHHFEQGPIRPPSEASSLLVRVSRNCPWNRCAFCPVYKGERFSLRSAAEVLGDLDAMRDAFGDVTRTVFLQDGNPLVVPVEDLVRIVEGIRDRFPNVNRITAYARAHTLTRRSLSDLRRIREAGLNRLHVGLESGCDRVLELVNKGATRAQQIEGGTRAKEAGFELSEYVMPGLGGRALSTAHAEETASALCAIGPDFIRLRSTTAVPGTELAAMQSSGAFEPLSEAETVGGIRVLIAGLQGTQSRIQSDHMMNLLMELNGEIPRDKERLLAVCDAFLELPEQQRDMFIIGRRLGVLHTLADLDRRHIVDRLDATLAQLGDNREAVFSQLRARFL